MVVATLPFSLPARPATLQIDPAIAASALAAASFAGGLAGVLTVFARLLSF